MFEPPLNDPSGDSTADRLDAWAFGLLDPAEEAALLASGEADAHTRGAQVPGALVPGAQAAERAAAQARRELLAAWTVAPPSRGLSDQAFADRVLARLAGAAGEVRPGASPEQSAKSEPASLPQRPTHLRVSSAPGRASSRPRSAVQRRRRTAFRSALVAVAAGLAMAAGLAGYFRLAHPPRDPGRLLVDYPALMAVDGYAGARLQLQDTTGDAPRPLEGGQVRLRLLRDDPEADHDAAGPAVEQSLTTDSAGSAEVRLPTAGLEPGPYKLVVEGFGGGWSGRVERNVRLVRPFAVLLSTDKPVYRAGDRLRMRAVVLARPSGRPAAGRTVRFQLLSRNGAPVAEVPRLTARTDRFGIAAGEIELPAELGWVRLSARVDSDGLPAVSDLPVWVGAYELPAGSAAVTLTKTWWTPAEPVTGVVRAVDAAGKPLHGAELRLTLEPVAGPAGTGAAPVAWTGRIDHRGECAFDIAVPADLRTADGPVRLMLSAEVHPQASGGAPAGAKAAPVRTAQVVTVSAKPLILRVVPESRRVVPGVENRLFVSVTAPDGRPAAGSLRVTAGTGPGATAGAAAAATVGTFPVGDDGLAEVRYVAGAEPAYRLTLAASRGGASVSADWFPHRASGAAAGAASGPSDSAGFLLRTARPVVRAGDTLDLEVAAAFGSGHVLVDVFAGETYLLSSHAVEVRRGAGRLSLDIPADLSGPLLLRAYRVADGKVIDIDRRVVLVEPARAAVIRADWRPPQAAGGTGELHVAVADADGRPAVAAIGASVFESALRQVAAGRPDLLRACLHPSERPRAAEAGAVPVGLPDTLRRRAFSAGLSAVPPLGNAAPDDGRADVPRADFLRAALLSDVERRLPAVETVAASADERRFDERRFDERRFADLRRTDSDEHRGYEIARRQHRLMRPLLAGSFLAGLLMVIALGGVLPRRGAMPGLLLLGAAGLGAGFLALSPMAPTEPPAAPEDRPVELPVVAEGAASLFGAESAPAPEWLAALSAAGDDGLLWVPGQITDRNGRTVLTVPSFRPARSRWAASLTAVTEDGRLGTAELELSAE